MRSLEASGRDFEGLKNEINAAERRWAKEDGKHRLAKETLEAEKAKEEEYRRNGELIECACCFDDIPPPSMTHCNADTPHFFCLGCARSNAAIDMTSLKYALRCMDTSRCEATFSREQKKRFLDAATLDKLERLQQQDEIRRADMGDLESCPFCDYAAICPPVDVDKIFECANPECMEVSCRLCKEKTHIPMSCEEFKKENGIGERHAIEEARTMALIRSCRKCKVQILKEDGCNKVVCTNCYSVICDFCGEDISKIKYQHFDGDGRVGFLNDKGKCPLYDTSNKRKEDQIEQAGKAAMEKVRKDNPDISEEDLKIKFAKAVEDTTKRHDLINPMDRMAPMVPYADYEGRIPAIPPHHGHRRNIRPLPLNAVQAARELTQQQLRRQQLLDQRRHQLDAMQEQQSRHLQRMRYLHEMPDFDVEEGPPHPLRGLAGGDELRGQVHPFAPQNVHYQPELAQDAYVPAWQPPGQVMPFVNIPGWPPYVPAPLLTPPIIPGRADGHVAPREGHDAMQRRFAGIREQAMQQVQRREFREERIEQMQRESRETIAAQGVRRRNEEANRDMEQRLAELDDLVAGNHRPLARHRSPLGPGLDVVDRRTAAELPERRRQRIDRRRTEEATIPVPEDMIRRPWAPPPPRVAFGSARESPFVIDDEPYPEIEDAAGFEAENRRREERRGETRNANERRLLPRDEVRALSDRMLRPVGADANSPILPYHPGYFRPDPANLQTYGNAPGVPINVDDPGLPFQNIYGGLDNFPRGDFDFETFLGPFFGAGRNDPEHPDWHHEGGTFD